MTTKLTEYRITRHGSVNLFITNVVSTELSPPTPSYVPRPGDVEVTTSGALNLPPRESTFKLAEYKPLEQTFAEALANWRRDCQAISSISKITRHPSYQAIIGLGEPVVPLLLREMERRPDHLAPALVAITGENPIKPEAVGKIEQMAAAWVRWGHEHGFNW